MPREVQDHALLLDMLDAAQSVVSMVAGMTLEAYRQDRRTRRAVEREIEILGEASRKISTQMQAAHPEVPWKKIAAQRHKLAHDYGEIQDEIIWRVATVHVPALIPQLRPLLPSGDAD